MGETVLHITDNGDLSVERIEGGIKSTKEIDPDSLLSSLRESVRYYFNFSTGLLPENILYYSENTETHSYYIVLDFPDGKADITYMQTQYPDFPLPRLVFGFRVESSNRISAVNLGVLEKGKTSEKSKLFYYPFSNVKGFAVCTGQNELPEIKQPYSLTNMPDYILSLPNNDDYFRSEHNQLRLGHRELTEHLKDKNTDYYYSDILVPSGKTLKDFFRGENVI